MDLSLLGPIMAALGGLYYFLIRINSKTVKNETCITRIESKIDAINDIEYIKEEITDLKDAIRMIK